MKNTFYNENHEIIDIEKFINDWKLKAFSLSKTFTNVVTFDIETTRTTINDKPECFICCGQFCFDGTVIICRRVEEILYLFKLVNEKIVKINNKRKNKAELLVYVHNLGYEYTFLNLFFDDTFQEILGDETSPITWTIDNRKVKILLNSDVQ